MTSRRPRTAREHEAAPPTVSALRIVIVNGPRQSGKTTLRLDGVVCLRA
jgi:predicted AAA+ superfamily ATPase